MDEKQELNIELFSNRVLVDVSENETKTEGGLIVPTTNGDTEEIHTGIVVAVGRGKKKDHLRIEMDASVGDKVMFQYAKNVVVNGKIYMLLNEDDIIMRYDADEIMKHAVVLNIK